MFLKAFQIILLVFYFGFETQSQPSNDSLTKADVSDLINRSRDLIEKDPFLAESLVRKALLASSLNQCDSLRIEANLLLGTILFKSEPDSAFFYFVNASSQAANAKLLNLWIDAQIKTFQLYRSKNQQTKCAELIDTLNSCLTKSLDDSDRGSIYYALFQYEWTFGKENNAMLYADSATLFWKRSNESEKILLIELQRALKWIKTGDTARAIHTYDSITNLETTSSIKSSAFHNSIYLLMAINQLDKAEETALTYLNYADYIKDDNIKVQALYDLSDVLSSQEKFKEAYRNYLIMDELEDSLEQQEFSQSIAEMQARFDVQQTKDQLSLKEAELEAKQSERNLFIVASGGLLLLLGGGFFAFRQRLRNRELQAETERKEKEVFKLRHVELKQALDEIKDSITYAKRIQNAILPSTQRITSALPDSFVIYEPKDIVAGDFYWLHELGEDALIAVADCTGHGVPGAMVSVVCHNALNRSVIEFQLQSPAEILDKTRELVIETFRKEKISTSLSDAIRDGMDIALCRFNRLNGNLEYAGANCPLWISTKSESRSDLLGEPAKLTIESRSLFEVKSDRQHIGVTSSPKPFTNHKIQLLPGETFYIFSDGLADQFGGERGKKLKYPALRELTLKASNKAIQSQSDFILNSIRSWQNTHAQVDDICMIGVKYEA